MTREELRRWIEARRAGERRERSELASAKPDPASSLAAALALAALAARLLGWPLPEDDRTRAEDHLGYRRWVALRKKLART